MPLDKNSIAKRISHELKDGFYVNLGIGIPTLIANYVPKNINVAALLSLVGLGSHETIVKIIADPNTDKNTHRIEAEGNFGKITTIIENVPDSNNPRTSRLATLSAIETLRNICDNGIHIGT